jgi:hypothetical protein
MGISDGAFGPEGRGSAARYSHDGAGGRKAVGGSRAACAMWALLFGLVHALAGCGEETDYVTPCPDCRRAGLALDGAHLLQADTDGVRIRAFREGTPIGEGLDLTPPDATDCAAVSMLAAAADDPARVSFACFVGAGRGSYLCTVEGLDGSDPSADCRAYGIGAGRGLLRRGLDGAVLIGWLGREGPDNVARLMRVDGGTVTTMSGPHPAAVPSQATWAGHDLLVDDSGATMAWVDPADPTRVVALRHDQASGETSMPLVVVGVETGSIEGPRLLPSVRADAVLAAQSSDDGAGGGVRWGDGEEPRSSVGGTGHPRVLFTHVRGGSDGRTVPRLSAPVTLGVPARLADEGLVPGRTQHGAAAYASGSHAGGAWVLVGDHDADGATLRVVWLDFAGQVSESEALGFAVGRPIIATAHVEGDALTVAWRTGTRPDSHLEPAVPGALQTVTRPTR